MIHVITGQTATGKTKYAINLADEINGELINIDARQIYKNLDIVTGKDLDLTDRKFELVKTVDNFDIGFYQINRSKIWLYDIIDANVSFSSRDYRRLAHQVIEDILSRKKTPIFVGGTYFYIKEMLYEKEEILLEADYKLRENLGKKSLEDLQNILEKENKKVFETLNNSEKNNPQRLIRKIEIEKNKNNLIVEKYEFPYEYKITGFYHKSKSYHHRIIENRVRDRLKNGALEESKNILKKYKSKDIPGFQSIGYKEILMYLEGKCELDELIQLWTNKEIQYAKRQLTFMKKDENMVWLSL